MHEIIVDKLNEIEKDLDIRILLACETGSRAWGFESPDSDYDIRIIYCHAPDWYLTIGERADSITEMFDNNLLDVTGWELRKSLRLLTKSNMTVFERLDSSIIYKEDPVFKSRILEISPDFYNPISSMYHYLGIAKSALADVTESEPYKLKRLFYGLRAGACCQWIYEHNIGAPPISYDKVLANIKLTDLERESLKELRQLKAEQSEKYMHSGEALLLELIAKQIDSAEKKVDSLNASNSDSSRLDELLRRTVLESSNGD